MNTWDAFGGFGGPGGYPATGYPAGCCAPDAFGPTYVNFGATEQGGSAAAQPADYATQAAQAYATYEAAQDPRVKLAKLQARIKNYTQLARQNRGVPILGDYYANQLRVMKAEAKALEQKLALQVEGEDATRDWRSLGQTTSAVGIATGLAATGLLIALIFRVSR